MQRPTRSLTAAQYEIMAAVWDAGDDGISIADIWQAISAERTIGRTTVLNQVDRLEKRGWLERAPGDGATKFRATLPKERASRQLVAGFVSDYFQGRAFDLMSALLGDQARDLTKNDVEKLRKLL